MIVGCAGRSLRERDVDPIAVVSKFLDLYRRRGLNTETKPNATACTQSFHSLRRYQRDPSSQAHFVAHFGGL
ncbi:hypothetical protein [Paenibacillus sp.]|uniref:hypothetical protein n=1 Tax=Paenibacillus sp. TaxID=58172 RepID=UPI0028A7F748|nr:hypothetical protein [Paenibacillus sp.]